ACLHVFFLKKNPRGYTKLSKILVGLKLCMRSFFNSRCKKVWVLVDLPKGKRRNKKDESGIIIRNKARLVAQGFEDPDYPDKVYKVVKALYGLHEAPRAWYETLANYLLKNGFRRGKIDQTLFIKKQKGDILLVQVYVDDI
nr:putative ribonuclease H-like domain-containing protein [Tanacetum cinerariifolium]